MRYADFLRWIYRGRGPNRVGRVMNRAGAIVAAAGLSGGLMSTLEVTGRKSGRAISFPVVVAVVDGRRYLVSMLGERARWVGNVRAAGGRAALLSGGREAVRLEEVPVDGRAPILKEYLRRAPGARPHIPVDKEAPLADFAAIAAAYPVFRVTPGGSSAQARGES